MDQQKIGRFLKELRIEKGITQAGLAEMLGISNRSVSRWENGVTMPDFDFMLELSKYYEVDITEILEAERKNTDMDIETQKAMLNAANYENETKRFYPNRIRGMFIAAIIGMIVYAVLDSLNLSGTEPFEAIVSVILGFTLGTLITGVIYTTSYSGKIRAYKQRLLKKLDELDGE